MFSADFVVSLLMERNLWVCCPPPSKQSTPNCTIFYLIEAPRLQPWGFYFLSKGRNLPRNNSTNHPKKMTKGVLGNADLSRSHPPTHEKMTNPPLKKGNKREKKNPSRWVDSRSLAPLPRGGKHAFCVSLSLGGCSSAEPLTFHDRAKIILFPFVAHFVGGFFGIATSACLWLPHLNL